MKNPLNSSIIRGAGGAGAGILLQAPLRKGPALTFGLNCCIKNN